MYFIRIISKIVKKDNKYQVQSEKGKNLGTYNTKEEAEKRLRQIEYFKHKESAKIKKTNPKIKKTVNKPKKTIKTSPTTNLSKKPNKDIKPNKKPYTSRNKPVSKRFKIRPKGIYPLQDISLPVFEDLLDQGFNMITLVAWSGACSYCKHKNGKTMSLSNWLNQLQHEAPVFEAFHVNSQSELKVWDKTGQLPDVYVNYQGNIR